MVFSVVYASEAVRPFSRDDLRALLDGCRRRNAAAEITGMLLYQDGHFLQLLEGDESDVRALLITIRADPRHSAVRNVWVSEGSERQFSTWSMGFRDLDQEPVLEPGFNDVLTTPIVLSAVQQPEVVRELLGVLSPTG